ncbi:hypothetical protein HUJ05_010332 [Dendroctonus ponderosae]|nr:hypothetical protein HUJ05_009485 [Dendroctonus ponderosae]KAH1025646.1 hypothetical protein HUJ05_010332 [Dendroctonus ponderosae]
MMGWKKMETDEGGEMTVDRFGESSTDLRLTTSQFSNSVAEERIIQPICEVFHPSDSNDARQSHHFMQVPANTWGALYAYLFKLPIIQCSILQRKLQKFVGSL